jgi:hypothetical protein
MHPQARTLNPKEVLRRLPQNEWFHFFSDINNYTGKSAHTLIQFRDIINKINEKSIIFHFERYDFERWIGGTLHDSTLARRINKLKKSETEDKMSEEKVRTLIHNITKNRIKELKNRLPKNDIKSTRKAPKRKNTKIRKELQKK